MLSVSWTSFVLSLWILTLCRGEKDTKPAKTRCDITPAFDSPYVTAFMELHRPGRGCTWSTSSTNSTGGGEHKSRVLHVIHAIVPRPPPPARRQRVHLRIQRRGADPPGWNLGPAAESGAVPDIGSRLLPSVFVLSSTQPVKWKVELVDAASARTPHIFVIPRQSALRFKKSRRRGRADFKIQLLQLPEDAGMLLQTVMEKYSAPLTSFNEVSGTSILLQPSLDLEAAGDSVCDVRNLTTTRRIVSTSLQPQQLSGCVAEGHRHPIPRPAYILELESAPPGESEVEVDITSMSRQPLTKNFCLVLKSPPNLRWRVSSRRVHGSIEIVTNTGISGVDMDRIGMHPVASRREMMNVTGAELISWVGFYINTVQSYSRIPQANRIQLRLPQASKSMRMRLPPGLEPVPSHQEPPPAGKLDLKEQLQHIIHTDCRHGHMTVAVPKQFMEDLGLLQDQLTLLDGSCGAEQNKTHVLLKSALHGCQTKMLDVDDFRVYSNAIVIHALQRGGEGEEYGSAYMEGLEGSGSGLGGDMGGGAFQDDEDFSSWRALHIEVQCQLPLNAQGQTEEEEETVAASIDYQLQLFMDGIYLRQRDFPATVTASTRLYVQASVQEPRRYGVVVQHCWFSPYVPSPASSSSSSHSGSSGSSGGGSLAARLHRFNVISEGCSALSTLQEDNGFDRAVRFSLPMESVHQALPDRSSLSLHCQLAVCSRSSDQASPDIPLCVSPAPSLDCTDLGASRSSRPGGLARVVTVGPLEMTDKEVDISIDSPNSSGGTGSGGQQRHTPQERVTIIEGLDSPTVISIAFGTFFIGMVFTGALWFIHTKIGPKKRAMASQASSDTSGDSTPGSMSPISA